MQLLERVGAGAGRLGGSWRLESLEGRRLKVRGDVLLVASEEGLGRGHGETGHRVLRALLA